jgi:CPA1 family monovalent cation:H+ antiporter
LNIDLKIFDEQINKENHTEDNVLRDFQVTYLEMLEAQRKFLTEVNHRTEYDEEMIRKYLALIDLEELKVREKILGE